MAWLLLIAGHETTVNLISNGLLALLTHPDQLAALRADPSLMDGAVEEMLRYDGPVETPPAGSPRSRSRSAGRSIPRGDSSSSPWPTPTATRRRFPDPGPLRHRRDRAGHVAFGHGIHYCLGAALARLEARIAIGTLLDGAPRHRARRTRRGSGCRAC